MGAKLEGLNVAYRFLEKSGLSGDLRKQVVAAAGGEYDYPKLGKALMAVVPKVKNDAENTSNTTRPSFNWQWKPRNSHPRQVTATTEDGELPDEGH